MTIPTENLDAMVEFLTDVSETSGDHFMQAAHMLRAQQTRIAELKAQAAIGRRAVDDDRLNKLLAEVEGKLYEAYGRREPECCGRGHGECCGDFVVAWTDADNATMDALSPVRNELAAILRRPDYVLGLKE